MGKKSRKNVPAEDHLLLPAHPTTAPIVDTHTHLASTFAAYKHKYPAGKCNTVYEFLQHFYNDKHVEAIVDVWCEAPVQKLWREFADSALTAEDRAGKWGGTEYYFVMGVHPHEARHYNDEVERDILEAMQHPRCVGWGEMGLDYHYDNSPREIQRDVFTRQLRHAVRLGKPLTIHTREADEDTERILKAEVPKDHRIHIHCFTDTPDFGQRLLDHFPNLYIGVTGTTQAPAANSETAATIASPAAPTPNTSSSPFRIILETDAPYMVPTNVYSVLSGMKGRLPLCHTAMIPWTADFVAGILGDGWDATRVMEIARENARKVYGI
ncbi:Metallo-dependent hydrolase [Schizophyllum commune Loenen D]|nr:Metallo-dependent hydrolase [Schizophyllum commune Loenen D]